ncbi:hypothetical protein NPIL_239041 [Nephila pilipes]|uniref:Uncharacterized protein n=1 Tax=Nephila pilipes TaxID=299642 RepID=A0A8X6UTY7_NEPPI|nr:hypothetical protein NPIL_239041 [Nephila pilipes]
MPFTGVIKFLQEFCTLFKSIEFTATEATGKRFFTSSTVIPIVKMMGSKINSVSCCSEMGKKQKESFLVQYKKRFGSIEKSHFLAKASLLHPRFKTIHFQDKALLSNGSGSSTLKLQRG